MNTANTLISRIANGLCIISCVLCLTLSYSQVASAQEAEVRTTKVIVSESGEKRVIIATKSGDEDEVIVDEVIITGDLDDGETPAIRRTRDGKFNVEYNVELEDFDPDDRERSSRERLYREEDQKEAPAKEDSPSGNMDPAEIRKRMLERRKRESAGQEEFAWPSEEISATEAEPEQQQFGGQREEEQKDAPSGDSREAYISAIVDNNLFRPLGSGNEEREIEYALTAVISESTEESIKKAIIVEKGGNKSYYVYEGDTFANEIAVEEIKMDVVTLAREGEPMELRLGEGTSSGSRGGGRSGGRSGRRSGGGGGDNSGGGGGGPSNMAGGPGGGGNRGGRGGFDMSRMPEAARRMLQNRGISMEQLRNNPALQQRLHGEFMRRSGGGGGRPQMMLRRGGGDRGRRGGR